MMDFRNTFLSLSKTTFVFLLILYLVLAVLEIIWPGFVSRNIQTNWLFVLVIGTGLISSFFSQEETTLQTKTSPLDYLYLIMLAVISFLIFFYKIGAISGLEKPSIAFLGGTASLLIALASIKGNQAEQTTRFTEVSDNDPGITLKRLLLTGKISLPIPLVLLLVGLFFILSAVPKNRMATVGQTNVQSITQNNLDTQNVPELDATVYILDSGIGEEGATRFAGTLRLNGLTNSIVDTSVKESTGVTIYFRAEQKPIVNLIKTLIPSSYTQIDEAPLDANSNRIVVTLGTVK